MVRQSLSLYFHTPFCTKRCPYCHFYVTPDDPNAHALLLEGFRLEWERLLPHFSNRDRLVSIYFGGGTPSLLSPHYFQTILDWINRSPLQSADAEITIEANPETLSTERVKEFKDAGINRMSIGVQALDDALLLSIGRSHGRQRALNGVEKALRGGISNISVDLMYDLPNQTLSVWRETLQQLSSLPITHLSLYNLILEPHSLFFKQKNRIQPLLPNEEESLAMLQEGIQAFEKMGLMRYEISAFAKPETQSRHNLGYWRGRPFFGIGPSAFSYFRGVRYRNVGHLKKYVDHLKENRSPIDFEEKLSYPDNLHELLAVGLRVLEGVDLKKLQTELGALPTATLDALTALIGENYLYEQDSTVRLTERGTLFYDLVASRIV